MPSTSSQDPTVGARSLADDLRGRTDEQLSALLTARPDLARPAPSDITTLAARANTRASTQRAMDHLDLAHLQTLEAAAVAAPGTPASVAVLLGQQPGSPLVAELLEDLLAVALLWSAPEGLQLTRACVDVIGDPAGLGPVAADAPEPAQVAAAVDALDRQSRAIVAALAWGPPTGVLPSQGSAAPGSVGAAGRSLLDADLLQRVDASHVVLPRHVALHLRGGQVHEHPALTEPGPEATTHQVDLDVADASVGGRAAELLVLTAEVIDVWGSAPPRVLRTGGLAVRDLSALATRLEITTAQTAWLVEVLHAAGLVARGEPERPSEFETWMPTGEADDWLEDSPEQRWAVLARAWLHMPAAASLVGTNESGRINALSTQTSWVAARQRRHEVLTVLASLPPRAAPDEDEITELLRWHHPLRMQRAVASGNNPAISMVQREAEWAGVLGRGTLSTPGRALVAQPAHPHTGGAPEHHEPDTIELAAAAMASLIPPAVEHVLLQADLTAIAPGRLDGPAQSIMRLISDVESRGGASVHRITEASLRRALDCGWSADRLLNEIAGVSRTGIPQPLEYLIRDVARRHGVARVGSALAYVRSDDEALLDRIEADRAANLLQFRRLAPTVLISPVATGTVLEVLREQQYGPLAESSDGGIELSNRRYHRTSKRVKDPVHTVTVGARIADQIVAVMRRGEDVRAVHEANEVGGQVASADPVVTLSVLREAAAESLAVWVGYADDIGGVRQVLIRPQRVEAGRVLATVDDSDQCATMALHRITGARLAT